MKPRPQRRWNSQFFHPTLSLLEQKLLLTNTAATWIGQDGHDFAGPSPTVVADGIQDVHLQISNIPNDRQIAWADLMGLGGGRWVYNGPYGPWGASLQRNGNAASADLFFEPDRVETGRAFNLVLHYDDGSTSDLWLNGGTADPNLRMPTALLQVSWVGQNGTDLTGISPAVGPNGFVDVVLSLKGLASKVDISAVRVDGPTGISWSSGPNAAGNANAELVRNSADPSQGQLYFSPDRDLSGQIMHVQVVYSTGQTDSAQVVAGSTNPTLAMTSPPLPTFLGGPTAQWLGQASTPISGINGSQGWVTLGISNIPSGRKIVAAAVTGVTNTIWAYRDPNVDPNSFYVDPYSNGIVLHPGSSTNTAQLFFAPDTQITGQPLSVRLRFDDGSQSVTSVTAGPTDLSKLSGTPKNTTVVAGPDADVQNLVNKYGKVQLSPGVYTLSQPLVINSPVSLVAPYGNVTLLFTQGANDPAWAAAIKINAGNTTLSGLTIRFSGPVRWNWDVQYGPTIIGSTDNLDPTSADPKANLVLTKLDIESPAPATTNEQAPNLIRLATAMNGTISDNNLRGGTTVVLHGPWSITGNRYLGTMPGTWAWEAFATHYTNNLVLANNTANPLPGSGRTWRFLVMTGSGLNDQVLNNQISGLGPLDTDTQSVNASELILTESYSIRFEGLPLGLSNDGKILQIPSAQGITPATGDIVAILNGPAAGQFRRVAQVLSPTTLLLANPLPAGKYDISVAPGFLNDSFINNTVDMRGSSTASGLVLVGNHYGTSVIGNTTYGGGVAIRAIAYPAEAPVQWGWTHDPFLGATISNNTLIDSTQGMTLSVDNSAGVKSTEGRTYYQATVQGNIIRWTTSFLGVRAALNLGHPIAMTIGDANALDPVELVLSMSNNWADVPPETQPRPSATVHVAMVNGQSLVDTTTKLPLPPPSAPSSLTLLYDTGSSNTDRITNDPRIKIGPASGAVSYRYRVGTGSFLPIANINSFLPLGALDGPVSLDVCGVNADGLAGPIANLRFTWDRTPPVATAPILIPQSDSGASQSDQVTIATSLMFQVSSAAGDTLVLLRDGSAIYQGIGSLLTDPGPISEAIHLYTVRRTDIAGNTSLSTPLKILVDRTPPAAPGNLTATGVSVGFSSVEPGANYFYRVGTSDTHQVNSPSGFIPVGIVPGINQVTVWAVDQAGNLGAKASVLVLLSSGNETATWLGQDGKDYTGLHPVVGPDGVQDIHIQISGLPTNRMIKSLEVQGFGGGHWQYGVTNNLSRAVVIQKVGAGTADLYFNPDRNETGRPFQINLIYGDGSTAVISFQGGIAQMNLQPMNLRTRVLAARAARHSSPPANKNP